MQATVLIRGAGDLASGVALRLHRGGLNVVMTELAQPLAVRRSVSFAEAVYEESATVEGVTARKTADPADTPSILGCLAAREIPVLVDPDGMAIKNLRPLVIVDARMTKLQPDGMEHEALLHIGLGPGFVAPQNCNAVIETERGHTMGRVIWDGAAQRDSMHPDGDPRRVLRAPVEGLFSSEASIGRHLEMDQIVGSVAGTPIRAPFSGVLRGLLRPGLYARSGMKIGDIDARDDARLCTLVSDKSLAVAGGVLEAILSRPEVRGRLWA